MITKELNIIDFITDLNLLEGSELSPAQQTIHKATYGLELSPAELDIYRHATGREIYEPREHKEATYIVGRQGGKSSRIGAIIATYEACRDHGLKRGERAYVLLIAPINKAGSDRLSGTPEFLFDLATSEEQGCEIPPE